MTPDHALSPPAPAADHGPIRRTWELLFRAGVAWDKDDAMRLAAALAMYTILSLSPLLVITIKVTAVVLGEKDAAGQVTRQAEAFLGPVGVHIAVVERRQSITALKKVFDPPSVRPGAAAGLSRPVVDHALASFRHPIGGQPHCRLPNQGMVAEVIHAQHDGCWTCSPVGENYHKLNRRHR